MENDTVIFFKNKIEKSIDQTIEYLRYCEKDKTDGVTEIGANEHLKFMLENGIIKMDLFIQLKNAVDNPNTEYKITLQ